MSKARHGLYVFLIGILMAVFLGYFSPEIVATTGMAWVGSTFFLVIVSLTASELVVLWIYGRPVSSDLPDTDNQ